MKLGIANDHRGYILKTKAKEYLQKKHYEIIDLGTDSETMVDYPEYAFKLGELVANGEVDFGIAICGTGIGISIACNKVKGIRCAKVDNVSEAKHTREDNNANILALNGTMPLYRVKDILDVFLKTQFSNVDRYIRRNEQITEYENKKRTGRNKTKSINAPSEIIKKEISIVPLDITQEIKTFSIDENGDN